LVPVKAQRAGKQRLAAALTEDARARLMRAMLRHILGVLRRCPEIAGIAVMTPEPDSLAHNTLVIGDPGNGVNEALAEALGVLSARGGVTRVAVIAGDLPLLTAAEVAHFVGAAGPGGIALAPDRSGLGTNAVCLPLPSAFRFHFGPGSLERHRAEAVALGASPAVVALTGFEFDVDEPGDLGALRGRPDYGFLPWPGRD